MDNLKQYELYSIDVKKLLFSVNINATSSKAPNYFVDLTETSSVKSRVAHKIKCSDNALFYQILKYTDNLEQNLIYVDFRSVFGKISVENVSAIASAIDNDPIPPYSFADHMYRLFDLEQGIKIRFSNNTTVQFVAFDRGANMARGCRMTFINKELYEKVNDDLNLGIDFNSIPMQLSKYYSYRGLYLSPGKRIAETKRLSLNEQTVVVLPDINQKPLLLDSLFTIDNNSHDDSEPHSFKIIPSYIGQIQDVHELIDALTNIFINKDEKQIDIYEKINLFDGEGIISPYYSHMIGQQLPLPKESVLPTSFQIRMPFTKGMLHEVDFQSFLDEYTSTNDWSVLDCFGIKRDLRQAHIILTQSMFKCKKWLEQYVEKKTGAKISEDNDPMRFFFNEFHERAHALYIRDTNIRKYNRKYETLNYQFLSTINPSIESLTALINQHYILGKDQIIENLAYATTEQSSINTIIQLARKNPRFIYEPALSQYIERELKQLRLDCALGRILTIGEHRFLSGDLMTFLAFLIDSISKLAGKNISTYKLGNGNHEPLADIRVHNKCYIPNAKGGNKATCAILRNPHLSRNEEYVLKKYSKLISRYDKYFKHLSGIIMLSSDMFGPMTLSGADFDGDTVKIFYDDIIVSKVLKNTVHPKKDFRRIVPFISIPTCESKEEIISHKAITKLALFTFSNQVGMISNIAVKCALNQYANNDRIDAENDYCSMATIICGLEIDSVKVGAHPVQDIKNLQNLAKDYCTKESSDYIKWNTAIRAIKGGAHYKLEETNPTSNEYKLIIYKKGIDNIIINRPSNSSHSLLHLPYIFAQQELQANDKQDAKIFIDSTSKSSNIPEVCFAFEKGTATQPNWEKSLNKDKKDRVKSLFLAFRNATVDLKKYYNAITRFEASPAYNKLTYILRIKFDSIEESTLKNSNETVANALAMTIAFLQKQLPNISSVTNSISKIEECNWGFVEDVNREKVLKKILFNSNIEIPAAVLEFLCDFSFSGFFILPLALNSILESYKAEYTPKEYFADINTTKRKDKYGYYQILLKAIYADKTLVPTEDDNLDVDEEDQYEKELELVENCDDTQEYDASGVNADYEQELDMADYSQKKDKKDWSEALIQKCINLLYQILELDSEEALTSEQELELLKYSWYGKTKADKEGYFFWNSNFQKRIKLNTIEKYIEIKESEIC